MNDSATPSYISGAGGAGRAGLARITTTSPGERVPAGIAVLGEVTGLGWGLENHHMALTHFTRVRTRRIAVSDRMILYVSRGAYHNATRDESQHLALAAISTGRDDKVQIYYERNSRRLS